MPKTQQLMHLPSFVIKHISPAIKAKLIPG